MTSLNRLCKQRLTAKETSIVNCEVFKEEKIAVQGIFVSIVIKAIGASLKVTEAVRFTAETRRCLKRKI